MLWNDGEYSISRDRTELSLERICALLAQTHWASQRSKDTIQASLDRSICYGVFHQGVQVGFARVVTDYATVYWLCDVIIDEQYRGKGLGKQLVRCILEAEELRGLNGILKTRDAHGLYEKYGFQRDPERFMIKAP